MKRKILIWQIILIVFFSVNAAADKGKVLMTMSECDYFVAEMYSANYYYALFERYRGYLPREGQMLSVASTGLEPGSEQEIYNMQTEALFTVVVRRVADSIREIRDEFLQRCRY